MKLNEQIKQAARNARIEIARKTLSFYTAGVSVTTLAEKSGVTPLRVYKIFELVPEFDSKKAKEQHKAARKALEEKLMREVEHG